MGGGGGAGMNYGAAGAAALGAYNKELGNQLNLLGSLLGDQNARIQYPEVTAFERYYRGAGRDLLREGRDVLETGTGMRAELLAPILSQLGYEYDVTDNREALAAEQAQLQALRADASALRQKLAGKKGKGKPKAQAKLKRTKKQIRIQEQRVGQLRAQPLNITNLRQAAPTAEETANAQIQDRLAQRVLQALDGQIPDDPRLLRELEKQENVLRERLLRQLGSGYETSSGGIEALANYNQRKAELLAETQRREIYQGRGLQLEGAQALEGMERARRGEALGAVTGQATLGMLYPDLAGGYLRQQQPFQFDREMQLRVALANQGIPTGAAATFGAFSNYADTKGENMYRLASALGAGGSMGGGNGGGGGYGVPMGSSSSDYMIGAGMGGF